jgi:CubicO group peptidase (beta-lactamase class C family)
MRSRQTQVKRQRASVIFLNSPIPPDLDLHNKPRINDSPIACPMVTSIPLHTPNRARPYQRHVAIVLFLAIASNGCAPKRLADVVTTETLEARLARTVRVVLENAVRDSAFPGAVAIIGNASRTLVIERAGTLDPGDSTRPDSSTLWDMASLTKVIVTTTAMMRLVEAGLVALDSPAVRYLPHWNAEGARRVTVRQLLTHSAGLPAWRPLYRETGDAASARRVALETAPDSVPGSRYVYSDIGFILLGLLIEHQTGDSLHHFAKRLLFEPMGMTDTDFRPDSARRSRAAPTERDAWRGRHLRGEVHDENAYRLDGVSGHAGLFSSGSDVARFSRMLLRGGELDGTRIVSDSIVRLFASIQDSATSHRALGWETATGSNSGGRQLSTKAFGHTGFTGTSIWVDPAQDLFIVLLTNRVNPTRENRRISGVRIALADSVVANIQAMTSRPFLEGGVRRH